MEELLVLGFRVGYGLEEGDDPLEVWGEGGGLGLGLGLLVGLDWVREGVGERLEGDWRGGGEREERLGGGEFDEGEDGFRGEDAESGGERSSHGGMRERDTERGLETRQGVELRV